MTRPTTGQVDAAPYRTVALDNLHRVGITDPTGRIIAFTGPNLAPHWLAWHAGQLPAVEVASLRLDDSYRVCECRHLAMSHHPTAAVAAPPDAGGLGAGRCGDADCDCPALRPIPLDVTAPAY